MDLLQTSSVSGNREGIKESMRLFAEAAEEKGLEVAWKDNPLSLVVGRGDLKHPDVGFLCHLDTVPPYFPPRVEGDLVYGRGAIDMKGPAVASFFGMLESSHDSVAMAFTGDEETTGEAAAFLSTTFVPQQVLMVPDQNRDFDITRESKGLLEFVVSVEGSAAHGSAPWLGENAVKKAIKAYQELEKVLELDHSEDAWANTLNLSFINTDNEAHNVIPASAEVGFDLRFVEEDVDYWISRIRETLDELGAELTVKGKGERIDVDVTRDIALYQNIVEKVTGRRPNLLKNPSSCDARFYAGKVPTIIISKCAGGDSHADDEYVEYSSLEDMKNITRRYLEEVR